MPHLTITSPSSLLPVLADREITPNQTNNILALLNSDITYPELLRFLAERAIILEQWDSPFGAGEIVEAFRG